MLLSIMMVYKLGVVVWSWLFVRTSELQWYNQINKFVPLDIFFSIIPHLSHVYNSYKVLSFFCSIYNSYKKAQAK